MIFLLTALFIATGFSAPPGTGLTSRLIKGKVTDNEQQPLPGVSVTIKGTSTRTSTGQDGRFSLQVPDSKTVLVFSYMGFKTREIKVGNRKEIHVVLEQDTHVFNEVVIVGTRGVRYQRDMAQAAMHKAPLSTYVVPAPQWNTEDYSPINENRFHQVKTSPLSTFSIDVDAASYANLRRFLNNGQMPPKDAVRLEEMINYFRYDYPRPRDKDPVNIVTEIAEAPWNPENRLVHIGLQGKSIPNEERPPSNLVFLIDVSGSMQPPNKLPLLQKSFSMLVDQLKPQDRVAIVTYAGTAGTVLESTPGTEKQRIKEAIGGLQAGGSTAGGEGIQKAYRIAEENFMRNGNNRVILATDGDFNVGVSSDGELQRLIEEKRETGVFLSVLGFGMGNYKDNKLELLADKGNGNYAYIDTFNEARKMLVSEFGGTLFTIAKDVKLQIEFNPRYVHAYRLIGYENRLLNDEDFKDDKKDAGEMGSGHTVTALYEIIPAGKGNKQAVDDLKYQQSRPTAHSGSHEVLTVKLRYKQPGGNASKEISRVLNDPESSGEPEQLSEYFRFSAAVAEFGMLLRDSEHKGGASYAHVLQMAESARGKDPEGYRAEFINLVKTAQLLDSRLASD